MRSQALVCEHKQAGWVIRRKVVKVVSGQIGHNSSPRFPSRSHCSQGLHAASTFCALQARTVAVALGFTDGREWLERRGSAVLSSPARDLLKSAPVCSRGKITS